jgi:hypothetical protein
LLLPGVSAKPQRQHLSITYAPIIQYAKKKARMKLMACMEYIIDILSLGAAAV